jgi:hypothetical protein
LSLLPVLVVLTQVQLLVVQRVLLLPLLLLVQALLRLLLLLQALQQFLLLLHWHLLVCLTVQVLVVLLLAVVDGALLAVPFCRKHLLQLLLLPLQAAQLLASA